VGEEEKSGSKVSKRKNRNISPERHQRFRRLFLGPRPNHPGRVFITQCHLCSRIKVVAQGEMGTQARQVEQGSPVIPVLQELTAPVPVVIRRGVVEVMVIKEVTAVMVGMAPRDYPGEMGKQLRLTLQPPMTLLHTL
jgi:hypothetical protein